jgi:hypothetical protein
MTEKANQLRGYDDSHYLKEMADGIITRRFASVEEAAKAVLDEEAGSNVDRLRRKFREQNWYERGLNDYVEAEINRRAAQSEPVESDTPRVTATGKPMSKLQIALDAFLRKITNEFTPTGTMAFFGAGITAGLAATAMRQMAFNPVLPVSFLVSLFGMILWANKAGKTATPIQAGLHLGALATLAISMIVGFSMVVPDPDYTAGSLPGVATITFACMVAGVYASEFIIAYGRRDGREKAPEIIGLAAATVVVAGLLGWSPILIDMSYVIKRADQGSRAYNSISEVYIRLKKDHPDIDLKPLRDAQKQIVLDAMRLPEWGVKDGKVK